MNSTPANEMVKADIKNFVELESVHPNLLQLLSNILDANGDALDLELRIRSAVQLIASLYFYDDDADTSVDGNSNITASIKSICEDLVKQYN